MRLHQAPCCPNHSAQSTLARGCTVGLVTGPHANDPCWHGNREANPGRLPQGRADAAGRVPNPGHPSMRHEEPPLGARVPPPKGAKRAGKSLRCGFRDGSPRPHHPPPRKTGSGPWPRAPRTGGRRRWIAQRQTPHMEARRTPPGALMPPPERAKPARKSVHSMVGDGSPGPHHPCPQKTGSGPQPHAPRTGVRGRASTQPRTHLTEARGAPSRRFCAAPTVRKASSEERALWGW